MQAYSFPKQRIMTETSAAKSPSIPPRRSYWTVIGRAWRLRCPICGVGKTFDGWFRMRPKCDHCGYVFDREPGYFLGSIYANYGLTALLVTALFFTGYLAFDISPDVMVWWLA